MRVPEFRVGDPEHELPGHNRREFFSAGYRNAMIKDFNFDLPRRGWCMQKHGKVNLVIVRARNDLNLFDTNRRRAFQPNGLPNSGCVVVVDADWQTGVGLLAPGLTWILSIFDTQGDAIRARLQVRRNVKLKRNMPALVMTDLLSVNPNR